MFLLLGTECLPGTMHRCLLIAMMLMVKQLEGVGTMHNDPKVGTRDVLKKEVQGEKKKALMICNKIMNKLSLMWDGIWSEMLQKPLGGWDEPSDEIDLYFLRDENQGAMLACSVNIYHT